MKTYMMKTAEVKRAWHLMDAQDKVVGKLATEIATKLIGKHKPTYTPHIDNGDYVVIINAEKIVVTGSKGGRKLYHHHSRLPGGISERTFDELIVQNPERIIKEAVLNMLPKNRLRDERMSRLKVYVGAEHKHSAQLGSKE
jgi:large subunit ribosomal protein L13